LGGARCAPGRGGEPARLRVLRTGKAGQRQCGERTKDDELLLRHLRLTADEARRFVLTGARRLLPTVVISRLVPQALESRADLAAIGSSLAQPLP
jgi:hypothetical protein